MQVYLTYFLIYAIFGWVMEVIFNGLKEGQYINCGVLNGPYCPIYGFAAVFILMSMDAFKVSNKIALFFIAMAVASIVEFITGFLLEKILGRKWWDYSNKPFNLMGHICLEYSLMFGAVGFILHEAIHPQIRRFVADIPTDILKAIVISLSLVFLVDVVHSFVTILGINEKFKKLEDTSSKIGEATNAIGTKIASTGLEAAQTIDKRRESIEKRHDLKDLFDKNSEKRILKAFPNLMDDLEKKGYDISHFRTRK